MSAVGGGITNCLFKVAHPAAPDPGCAAHPIPPADNPQAGAPSSHAVNTTTAHSIASHSTDGHAANGAEGSAAERSDRREVSTSGQQQVAPPATSRVLVRKFGENTEIFIDRAEELAALKQLNAAGFGAAVLATFRNGRVEQCAQPPPCNQFCV